jgi:phosphopantothenoylcysteine decarboxylase/phosphopantothenate--cysteine ligase
VGFAAETEDLVARARAKLRAKGLDLIVANEVRVGFGGETSAAVLLRGEEPPVEIPLVSKRELADRICDEIVRLRARGDEPAGTPAPRSR